MKTLLGTLALCALFALSSVAIAADTSDPVVGTWKFNAAKSKGNVPMPKSETRTYAAAPDGVALTYTRVSADGKDYPVTGSDDFDALSAKKVDANTIDSIQKRMGKEVGTTRRSVSADGKSLTLVSKLTTPKGTKVDTTMVYDRQ